MDYNIYFYNSNGKTVANLDFFSLPLYKGMKIEIHGYKNDFTVKEWFFRIEHPDKDPGLHVYLNEEAN